MPEVGKMPEVSEVAMPPLAESAAAQDKATLPLTLKTELDKLAMARGEQPAVLGISLGHEHGEIGPALTAEGFVNCLTSQTPLTCERTTDSLKDTVSVWSTSDQGAWALLRTITFTQPAPRELILEQFTRSYPGLMRVPHHTVSSGEGCTARGVLASDVANVINQASTAFGNPETPAGPDLMAFAMSCPLFYSVEFGGAGDVEAAYVVFADMTGVTRLVEEQARTARDAEEERRQKLSTDLKL
jgi:hypothetical protein